MQRQQQQQQPAPPLPSPREARRDRARPRNQGAALSRRPAAEPARTQTLRSRPSLLLSLCSGFKETSVSVCTPEDSSCALYPLVFFRAARAEVCVLLSSHRFSLSRLCISLGVSSRT
ncbi:unnamed protein product [Ectocarpus fasciculatus]